MQLIADQVKNVLVAALGVNERATDLGPESPLLGALPELDSLAVINVITALERHFGIHIDDDEVSADQFLTLGTLTAFIEEKIGA